jgi:hypothetical protein
MRVLRTLFAALLLFLVTGSVFALDSLTVHSGLILVVNSEENGAPSLLTPVLGAWIPVSLPAPAGWSWEAGVMMAGMRYRYEDERAVPVEIEAANSFFVAALAPDLRFGRGFPLAPGIELWPFAGVSLFLRIPIIPYDDAASDMGALASYLLIRSLYPEIGASLRWEIVQDLRLTFDLRASYPLFNFFDRDVPSLADHFTTGLLVGLEFPLGTSE